MQSVKKARTVKPVSEKRENGVVMLRFDSRFMICRASTRSLRHNGFTCCRNAVLAYHRTPTDSVSLPAPFLARLSACQNTRFLTRCKATLPDGGVALLCSEAAVSRCRRFRCRVGCTQCRARWTTVETVCPARAAGRPPWCSKHQCCQSSSVWTCTSCSS